MNLGEIRDEDLRCLVHICLTFNVVDLERFHDHFRGYCISLKSPTGAWLRLTSIDDINNYNNEILYKLENEYLGAYENLMVIGAIQCGNYDIPIFVGKSQRVFCHFVKTDYLYQIASNIIDFFNVPFANNFKFFRTKNKLAIDNIKFEKLAELVKHNILKRPGMLNTSAVKFGEINKKDKDSFLHNMQIFDDLARCSSLEEIRKYVLNNANVQLKMDNRHYGYIVVGNEYTKEIPQSIMEPFKNIIINENAKVEIIAFVYENDLKIYNEASFIFIAESGGVFLYDWIAKTIIVMAECLLSFCRLQFPSMGYCPTLTAQFSRIGKVIHHFGQWSTCGVSVVQRDLTSTSKFIIIYILIKYCMYRIYY
ncbi:hypothetical protein MRV_0026 [Murid herpesvirus 3]|uniref:Uncharacterized protein n=2 Tax=Murid betaherpesvirus 3 TaxID=2560603 RepID=A0A1P8VIT2_9BETA|nr:hypothetical protein MRV_0026 [Murine roseolovirus]APZ76237.1 hypothetical protein MRV_0026 [Murid betaherpesvirus 3]AYH64750.1 hypothetical protein MRV_0026 [Murid herpesvirus 3]